MTGGLHQRPEFNVALDAPELDPPCSPTEVWPDGKLPAELVSRSRCSARFFREKWLVDADGSRIEMALDGEVKAGEFAEPICEFELELLSGDTRAVLKLANQLVSQNRFTLWQFEQSRARLSFGLGNALRELKPTRILKVPAKASIEQVGSGAGAGIIIRWRYHEELLVRGVKGAKAEVLARQWGWCVTF